MLIPIHSVIIRILQRIIGTHGIGRNPGIFLTKGVNGSKQVQQRVSLAGVIVVEMEPVHALELHAQVQPVVEPQTVVFGSWKTRWVIVGGLLQTAPGDEYGAVAAQVVAHVVAVVAALYAGIIAYIALFEEDFFQFAVLVDISSAVFGGVGPRGADAPGLAAGDHHRFAGGVIDGFMFGSRIVVGVGDTRSSGEQDAVGVVLVVVTDVLYITDFVFDAVAVFVVGEGVNVFAHGDLGE